MPSRSEQNQPNSQRPDRDHRPSLSVSRKIRMRDIAPKLERPEKPADFSDASWEIIIAATDFVNELELITLDRLIDQYLETITRAELCGCNQCRLLALSLSDKLDQELFRQRHSFAAEQQYLTDLESNRTIQMTEQEKIQDEIKKGMVGLYLNKLEANISHVDAITESPEVRELERRAIRLKAFLDKATKDPETHLKIGLTPRERMIVNRLLKEARERRALIREKKKNQ